jgi:hypothetical protein
MGRVSFLLINYSQLGSKNPGLKFAFLKAFKGIFIKSTGNLPSF